MPFFQSELSSERRHYRINRQILYESTTNSNRNSEISNFVPQKRNSLSLRKTNSNGSRTSPKRKNSIANSHHSGDGDSEFDDDTSTYRPNRHFRLSGASSNQRNSQSYNPSQHTTAVRNSPVSWQPQTPDPSTRRTSWTAPSPQVPPTTAPTTADTNRQPTAGSSADKSLPPSRDIRIVEQTLKGRHGGAVDHPETMMEQPEQIERVAPTPMDVDEDLHVDTVGRLSNIQDDIISPALRNNTNRYSDSPAAAQYIADKLDAASIDRRVEMKQQRRMKRRKFLKRISGMRCGDSSDEEESDAQSFNAGREVPGTAHDSIVYENDIFLVPEETQIQQTNFDWRSRARVKKALKRLSCRKDSIASAS